MHGSLPYVAYTGMCYPWLSTKYFNSLVVSTIHSHKKLCVGLLYILAYKSTPQISQGQLDPLILSSCLKSLKFRIIVVICEKCIVNINFFTGSETHSEREIERHTLTHGFCFDTKHAVPNKQQPGDAPRTTSKPNTLDCRFPSSGEQGLQCEQ